MMLRHGWIGLSVLLSACATPPLDAAPPTTALPWLFENNRAAITEASCQEPASEFESEQFYYKAEPVSPENQSDFDGRLNGLSLVGIWSLTSGRDEFGGLSGLVVSDSGDLMAVSDQGQFIVLPTDRTTGAPAEFGRIAPMRGEDGALLAGKTQGDAEGLAMRDGVAFVSFERDHRVSAFDLQNCRGAAREVVISRLKPNVAGVELPNNRGPEGLALMHDGSLRVGIEARETGSAVSGTLTTDGALVEVIETSPPAFQLLTGIDHRDGLTAIVYRAYDPVRGNRISFTVERGAARIASGSLKPPEPVDNIEGIALGPLKERKRRLWLISDDNFNPRQRTLLFAFELDATG